MAKQNCFSTWKLETYKYLAEKLWFLFETMGSFQAYCGLSCISLGPFPFRLPLFESSDAFVRPSTLRGIPVFGTSGRRKIKVEQIGMLPNGGRSQRERTREGTFWKHEGFKMQAVCKKTCIAHIAPKSLSYDLISKNSWTTAVRLKNVLSKFPSFSHLREIARNSNNCRGNLVAARAAKIKMPYAHPLHSTWP